MENLVSQYRNLELHPESKKRHPSRVENFAKYYSILKILSPLQSAKDFLQNHYNISHLTLGTLPCKTARLKLFRDLKWNNIV